jgi:TFIIF-interacting CTD phosphatase-like protein
MPILSWYDDRDDQLLYEYIPLLKDLHDVEDVRPFLMAMTKDNVIDIPKGIQLIKAFKD